MLGNGVMDGFDDKLLIHGLRKFIANNHPRIPVNNGYKVHPAPLHSTIGDVNPPDVVGVSRCHIPQKIWVDILSPVSFTQVGAGINDSNAHISHIVLDTLTIYLKAQLQVIDVITNAS